MSKDIEITWEVDDGYVGSRPHSILIPAEEFEDMDRARSGALR